MALATSRMRVCVPAEPSILLDKKDNVVRISINEADVKFGILVFPADEEPQLFARANGSRTMNIFKEVGKCHSKINDC